MRSKSANWAGRHCRRQTPAVLSCMVAGALVRPPRALPGQLEACINHPAASGVPPSPARAAPLAAPCRRPFQPAAHTPQPWVPRTATVATRRCGAGRWHGHHRAGSPRPAPSPPHSAPAATHGTASAPIQPPQGGEEPEPQPPRAEPQPQPEPQPRALGVPLPQPCVCPCCCRPAAALQSPPYPLAAARLVPDGRTRACAARCPPALAPPPPRPEMPACGERPVLPGHSPACLTGCGLPE